jgi:hypothetical protein
MFTFYTSRDLYTITHGEDSRTFPDVEVMISVESFNSTLGKLQNKMTSKGILPEDATGSKIRCHYEVTTGYLGVDGHEKSITRYVCNDLSGVEEYMKLFNVDIGNPMKIYW